jgi:hypothetical protein
MSEQESSEAVPNPPSPDEATPAGIDPAVLKKAMRAFRKKLKLSILDDESKLGGRYTSGGRKSAIVAIQPPYGYEPAVWQALVADGRLRDTGRGFYELNE